MKLCLRFFLNQKKNNNKKKMLKEKIEFVITQNSGCIDNTKRKHE